MTPIHAPGVRRVGTGCAGQSVRALKRAVTRHVHMPLSPQPCGYYQLKRFAATRNDALKMSFVEDASEYRLTEDAVVRQAR